MKAGGRVIIPAKPGETHRLYTMGCVHLGNVGCAEESFRRYVERIRADPLGRWIGLGDYIDAIGFRDRRFDPASMPDWIRVGDLANLGARLFGVFAGWVEPIRGKCVGLAFGNHEWRLMHDTDGSDRWAALLGKLGVRDLGIGGIVDLVYRFKDGREERFRIGLHHGKGAAQTRGGKLNAACQFAVEVFPRADIVLSGHTHERLDTDVVGVDADDACETVVDCTRLAAACGTWLRTYTQDAVGYAERAGYRPTAIGNTVILIDPATRSLGTERPR